MSTQLTPEERMMHDTFDSPELDAFFDDSEAALVGKAERSLHEGGRGWMGVTSVVILLVAAASWFVMQRPAATPNVVQVQPHTASPSTVAIPTSTATRNTNDQAAPPTANAIHTAQRSPEISAPSSDVMESSKPHAATVTTSAASNRDRLVARADSLDGVLRETVDVADRATLAYTIGVLRSNANDVHAALLALGEAERLARSAGLSSLVEKVHREQQRLADR